MSKSVKRGKLTDYVPNEQNSNKGSERGQGMIENSFRKYGAGRSLLVDKNGKIIAGNHSQEGALDAGIEDVIEIETDGKQIVVVKRRDLDLDSPDDMRAIELAYVDNRSNEISLNWDAAQIVADVDAGVDLSGMFTPVELADLIAGQVVEDVLSTVTRDNDTPVDPTDELIEKWGTAEGQLWAIGEHRVICGDCRDSDTVSRLFDGRKAQIAFTSPPYAQQRQTDYGGVAEADYVDWFEAVANIAHSVLGKNGSFFVNIKPNCQDGERVLYVFDLVLRMKREWGWHFIDEFCWQRHTAPGAWSFRFRNGFEPVYHFCKGTKSKFYPRRVGHVGDVIIGTKQTGVTSMTGTGTYYNIGPTEKGLAQPDNVISVTGVEHDVAHSAMFPVGLPEFFIKAFTDKTDIVYEPFLGSGTTLISAEQQGRVCYGCEILPKYLAVVLDRAERHGIEGIQLLDG